MFDDDDGGGQTRRGRGKRNNKKPKTPPLRERDESERQRDRGEETLEVRKTRAGSHETHLPIIYIIMQRVYYTYIFRFVIFFFPCVSNILVEMGFRFFFFFLSSFVLDCDYCNNKRDFKTAAREQPAQVALAHYNILYGRRDEIIKIIIIKHYPNIKPFHIY